MHDGAREQRLSAMMSEYDSLRAELRTLLTLGFGAVTLVGATVAAGFLVAYQLDRREILVALPAVGIALAGILIEFHMYYLTCNTYLSKLEQRINSEVGGPAVMAWHSRVLQMAWPSPPAIGALHHDAPTAFGGTAIFIVILVLGSIYLADLHREAWKSALVVTSYISFYVIPWLLLLRRLFLTNPQRLKMLEDGLDTAFSDQGDEG